MNGSEPRDAILRPGEDAALVGLLFSFFDDRDNIARMSPEAATGLHRLVVSMKKDIRILSEEVLK